MSAQIFYLPLNICPSNHKDICRYFSTGKQTPKPTTTKKRLPKKRKLSELADVLMLFNINICFRSYFTETISLSTLEKKLPKKQKSKIQATFQNITKSWYGMGRY